MLGSPPTPAALATTLTYSAIIFGPVLCGVMLEDTLRLVRSWMHGPSNTTLLFATDSSDGSSSLLVAKITAMAVLGFSSLVLGLLPLKLARCFGWGRHAKQRHGDVAEALHSHGGSAAGGVLLSVLLCFGGGVLLCTTFVHMLPEVQESFESLEESGKLTGTLVGKAAYLLMCAGFFVMYLVEELVHAYLHWRNHKGGRGARAREDLHHTLTPSDLFDPEDTKKSPLKSLKWDARDLKPSTVVMEYTDGSKVNSEVPPEFCVSAVTFSNPWGASHLGEKQLLRVDTERPCCKGVPRVVKVSAKCHKMHHDHVDSDASGGMPDFLSGANHHSHAIPTGQGQGEESNSEESVLTAIRGLLIVLALCVHELFEGLAVGLESSTTYVWYLLMAVACHKLVIAFCIGVELVAMRSKVFHHVLYVTTFAVVSPLGIAIGILVTDTENIEDGMLSAFLQGLATGTLLYVVFFEILERQRACGHSSLRQFLAVLTGFLVMFGLMMLSSSYEESSS